MVLIPRSAVLGLVLGVALLAGCSESLFGAHSAGHGGDDDGGVPGCTAPCDADAAADFGGSSGRWRYLDDHRDRTWVLMTAGDQVLTGADPGTRITTCRAFPDEPACSALPGALLVTTAAPAKNDPAIELAVNDKQVLDLHLEAFVPPGAAGQTIRLYRNSREDALFTATAGPGTPLDHTITLAAIPGDRFLVAVAAGTAGAANIGLNLRASASKVPFPATCQVAVPFASASGNAVEDVCGATVFTHYTPPQNAATPPSLDSGPFPELGKATSLFFGDLFQRGPVGPVGTNVSPPLDWTQDVTVQLWAIIQPSASNAAVLFSDLDPDLGSGTEISIGQMGTSMLEVQTCAAPPTTGGANILAVLAPYRTPAEWHFIRAVRSGGHVRVCVDGVPAAGVDALACTARSPYPLLLGAKSTAVPVAFSGQIDDVRVFTGALPCDPVP